MTKQIMVKPGSIMLYKEYGFFKKLFAKLTKKELPYNKFLVFIMPTVFYSCEDTESEKLILEPKKNYSNNEISQLANLLKKMEDYDLQLDDILVLVNLVRPNTIDIADDVSVLINNKFYRITKFSDETKHICTTKY
jgi:hypothetical protein